MQRAVRLAEIVEIVRDGRLHTARDLAISLKVSERTIYRDMDTLVASGVPIEGERGVGYLLREPVFLPPMALSFTELEALSLGMAIVKEAADPELQVAAESLLGKLEGHATVRRRLPTSWGIGIYPFETVRKGFAHMPVLRRAIREQQKIRLRYESLEGHQTERVIRPLQLEYWGRVWTCTSWCELRRDFRVFRVDCMNHVSLCGSFRSEHGKTLQDYLSTVQGHSCDAETNT